MSTTPYPRKGLRGCFEEKVHELEPHGGIAELDKDRLEVFVKIQLKELCSYPQNIQSSDLMSAKGEVLEV